ncbi:hypothetical protein DY000_02010137 [Brassica cretica]|uniref:Uncharacterized protein n=1 Tax=Brassica cretica TaxID=69181 RepID=A0ABQ7C2V6_BRACR|nr:hypothetical protein DY000_02010137 [Brassica cretica]
MEQLHHELSPESITYCTLSVTRNQQRRRAGNETQNRGATAYLSREEQRGRGTSKRKGGAGLKPRSVRCIDTPTPEDLSPTRTETGEQEADTRRLQGTEHTLKRKRTTEQSHMRETSDGPPSGHPEKEAHRHITVSKSISNLKNNRHDEAQDTRSEGLDAATRSTLKTRGIRIASTPHWLINTTWACFG